MNVAKVVLGSGSLSSSGRRSFQTGSILILSVFSSCFNRPCSTRTFENSESFSAGIPSWSESSLTLCHAPFLMTVKNLSRLKPIEYLIRWMRYFSLGERLVEFS